MEHSPAATTGARDERIKPPHPKPTVTLRRISASDVDALMEFMTDDQVSLYTCWDTCRSREDVVHYLNTFILPHPWFKAICVDGPVGFVYVDRGTGLDRYKAQISGCVARRYWGTGVGTAVLRMVRDAVLEEWPDLERVETVAAVENMASQRIAEAAGFQKEGLLRNCYFKVGRFWDIFIYSYLRSRPNSRL